VAKPIAYVIELKKADLTHYDEQIEIHKGWINKHCAAGTFLLSGPTGDRTQSGIIIARAESRAALDAILSEDPLLQAGVVTHEVTPFTAAVGAHAHLLSS